MRPGEGRDPASRPKPLGPRTSSCRRSARFLTREQGLENGAPLRVRRLSSRPLAQFLIASRDDPLVAALSYMIA